MTESESTRLMERFAAAWNRHDCGALLEMVTEDCVFDAAAGPEPFGTRYCGREALQAAFSAIWQAFPNASWTEATHFALGDRGFSEWTFRGTRSDGTTVVSRGIDVFVFREGRIAYKDTFRKMLAR